MSPIVPCWRCSSCTALMGGVYSHSESLDAEIDTTLILPDPCSAYDDLLCPYCGESTTLSTLEVSPIVLDDFVASGIGFPISYELRGEEYHFMLSDEDFVPHSEYGIYMLTLYRSSDPIASVFLDTPLASYFSPYGVDEDEDQFVLSFGAHQIFLLP